MPYCRNCGNEVSPNMAYCPKCGTELAIPKTDHLNSAIKHDQPTINTSGQRALAVVPPEIKGWSWGAFLLWWIWGIGNNVYISFLTLIPYVGQIVMPFVLGVKGNEWAWRNKRWDSIAHFKEVQWIWVKAGLIVLVLELFIFFMIIVLS